MSEAARHRQAARVHEQRESWQRAIEEYERAIQVAKREEEDVDLALYNRVGDLYRRVGNINRAVHYYELAADGHLAAGFYNNAIALCNKILRNQPNRHSAYLKLGKIGASKGILSDARKHFLEYAERMQRSGQLDEAFAALVEFADLSPDPEVRLMIADQLLDHARKDEAVEQLRLAWRHLTDEGRDADAQEVRSRVLDIAPERDPHVDPPAAYTATAVDAEGVIDLPEILPYDDEPVEAEEEAASGDAKTAGAEELADLDVDFEDDELLEAEVIPEELDFAPALPGDEGAMEGTEEAEATVSEEDLELMPSAVEGADLDLEEDEIELEGVEIEATALYEPEEDLDQEPLLAEEIVPTSLVEEVEPESERAEDESERIDPGVGEIDLQEAFMESEGLGAALEVEPVELEEEEEEEETPSATVRVAELEGRLASEGRTPELLVELADALLEIDERARATTCLNEAVEISERHSRFAEARRILDELLRLDVNDVRAYQKRIEVALKAGDRRALLESYLDLADCLDRTEAGNKARIVYQRVLELDPENGRAMAALDMLGDEAPPTPLPRPRREREAGSATPSGSNSYVDLSALILEEKAQSRSTRFTVSSPDPQSEAEVNFSDMLDQFKSKVEEAIEKEDAASHYDLGVAYKEMGLLDEAVAEFQIAARGLDYRLRAIEMLGACFIEKADYRIALKVLRRALQVPLHRDEDLVGIFYAMGRAHEALEETANALESYERVMGCDVQFKDVAQRVMALRR
jgi:tetratricopeptide (TPR) repeat protein